VAIHVQQHSALDLPHPFRAAAPLLVLALFALLFEADPALPWIVGVLAGTCFGCAAALRAGRARIELAAVRRTADRLIVHEPYTHEAHELIQWRSEELTNEEARSALVREFGRTLRQLDAARLPSASPMRRAAVRRYEPQLRAIAERIGDDCPIAARGILLARDLLRSPASPLYAEDAERLLGRSLTRVAGALEP
jgi:hypothetical protein